MYAYRRMCSIKLVEVHHAQRRCNSSCKWEYIDLENMSFQSVEMRSSQPNVASRFLPPLSGRYLKLLSAVIAALMIEDFFCMLESE